MNMRKGRAAFVILGSLIVIVSSLAGQYKVKTENGVTIVTNGKKPDPPKGSPTKLVLEEIYTVGGGDAPDSSFVEISALDVLKDGTVFVLDTKDSRVKVFDAKGKFLRAFGKAGQGPGEMNQPVGILITPENEVLVEDALNQRLAVFGLDGTFSRHISTAKALGLSGIQMDGHGLIVARSMGLGEAGKMSMDVKTYDRDFNPKVKLASFEFPVSLQAKINPFSAMNLLYAKAASISAVNRAMRSRSFPSRESPSKRSAGNTARSRSPRRTKTRCSLSSPTSPASMSGT
jgi:hypothetical protein